MCYALFAVAAVWYWIAFVAAVKQSNAETRQRAAQDDADAIAQDRQDDADAVEWARIDRDVDENYYPEWTHDR